MNLFKLVNEQSWLTRYSVLDIYPAKINIKINKAGETVKPVTADLSLQYEDGFGLVGKIKITPNSVKLKGSEKLLAGINSVKTKKTILTGLKEKTVIEVQLEGIEGVSIAPQKVTIELDVQKIADREIEGVVLSVLDKPKERDILLNPDKVTVTVRGGIDIISTLKAEEIKAVINYPEIVNDTTGITVPKVILPETIDFIDIKPPHIKYIIKKN
ncbi:MAG: hypothetical protein B6D45_11020 [Ignavibacteriales bacterium UTCHB3]|nr:MAG: hypothetical protein B6D45_11020 [Ignavibacteriales bacterium UTCHB3]